MAHNLGHTSNYFVAIYHTLRVKQVQESAETNRDKKSESEAEGREQGKKVELSMLSYNVFIMLKQVYLSQCGMVIHTGAAVGIVMRPCQSYQPLYSPTHLSCHFSPLNDSLSLNGSRERTVIGRKPLNVVLSWEEDRSMIMSLRNRRRVLRMQRVYLVIIPEIEMDYGRILQEMKIYLEPNGHLFVFGWFEVIRLNPPLGFAFSL